MRIPRKVALFGAAVVILALLPASSAVAYNAKEKKSEVRQNARTKKLSKDLTAVKKSLLELPGLITKVDGIDGRLKAIEAAAPQLVKGLNDLKDASLALKAGLEGLKSLATSTEYGIGQVFIGASPASGAFVVTPDIPDAVQQAQVSQTFVPSASGTITVRVGVRSAESDGTGSTNPAASCRVTVTGAGAGNFVTSTPNAGLGGAPFYPIANKSPQTSETETSFPFGPISTDQLTDLTAASNSSGTATATAGSPYNVTLDCVDTTPSTTDPTA
jgi:hypothetical protein